MKTRVVLQFVGSALAGIVAACLLEPDLFASAASNIVSALSIMTAAVFPTVVLTATVLKPTNMSSALVERYRGALRTQVLFFFGFLMLALIGIAVIIAAQIMNWHLQVPLPGSDWHLELSGIFNAGIVFMVTLLALRLPAFLNGLMSLLTIHIDGVAQEVAQREKQEREIQHKELDALPSIAGHQKAPTPWPYANAG